MTDRNPHPHKAPCARCIWEAALACDDDKAARVQADIVRLLTEGREAYRLGAANPLGHPWAVPYPQWSVAHAIWDEGWWLACVSTPRAGMNTEPTAKRPPPSILVQAVP